MKKTYKKPLIAVESFQLDAAIAGACADSAEETGKQFVKIGLAADQCVHEGGYFADGVCDVGIFDIGSTGILGGGDVNDAFCYHGPIAGLVFINS